MAQSSTSLGSANSLNVAVTIDLLLCSRGIRYSTLDPFCLGESALTAWSR